MPNRHIRFFALVVLLAATLVARADQVVAQPNEIDDLIKAEMQRQNIRGLSLVVLKDGEIVKAAGYGLANIKLQVPATPETVYRIASVSKQFIATGIAAMEGAGRSFNGIHLEMKAGRSRSPATNCRRIGVICGVGAAMTPGTQRAHPPESN
jgi:hypothetical protein